MPVLPRKCALSASAGRPIKCRQKCGPSAGWRSPCAGSATPPVAAKANRCISNSRTNSSLPPRTKARRSRRKKILTKWPKPTKPLRILHGDFCFSKNHPEQSRKGSLGSPLEEYSAKGGGRWKCLSTPSRKRATPQEGNFRLDFPYRGGGGV